MVRGLLAALAALALVAVFSVLIVESRATQEDYFTEHAERMRLIEISRDDIVTIVEGASSAFEVGRPVAASTELALTRLSENNAALQDIDEKLLENADIQAQLTSYNDELARFIAQSRTFQASQSAFATALRDMQEESPFVVKELRRINLRLESQNVFSLALAIIEHATSVGNHDGARLAEQVEALRENRNLRANAPAVVSAFIDSAGDVIEQRAAAAAALQTVSDSGISEALWTLSNAILEDNHVRVSRSEKASLLLTICTILVLVGTGYAMWRLQASYRELNVVNNTLEERVTERTEELSDAYTELKESQVQLVQAEKMSSLGELVAGISHEINTPLWYLISNSTVLQERMETVSDFCGIAEDMLRSVRSQEDVKEAVKKGLGGMSALLNDGFRDDIDESRDLIKDSIEGLEELTELAQSLKDFSRLDRAKVGELDIHDGIDKALLIAKNKLKNKVTVHKHYGDLPQISCSPSQINQVFLNLLTNAADAIEESGDLVIKTMVVDAGVQISFSDTGCGIPKDVLEKIRDPFFTTKEVGKGTGLGLSIVDQIITSHGGELLIDSEPDRGTTVTLVLPLVAKNTDDELADDAANTDVEAANDAEREESPSPEAA